MADSKSKSAFVLFLVLAIAFLIASSTRVGVEGRQGQSPFAFCYRECSRGYGLYECNVDCVDKKHGGGSCISIEGSAQTYCCCDP